ncbi:MAG TPA: M36 family metallopeptidase, partial [Thermoanaerobaculia bacterium]|nr:M36 family metallopeptidase [Thermoanaerobaculia bacterium]
GAPPGRTPAARGIPNVAAARLRVDIRGTAPQAGQFTVGTPQFRYWVAAEALRRSADFWGGILPQNFRWATGGDRLPVQLDEGTDLNAFYSRTAGGGIRAGLSFFRANVSGQMIFTAESPDVVAHELGHAVLDGIRPQLFATNAAEAASFHEAFGDISAILTALQLPERRSELISSAIGSNILQSSRISQVAEQLGWGIRQRRPDAVDSDALRNAVNSFFYRDPIELPPSAPANLLSSAPHSFSRVFSGAAYDILANMFRAQGASPTEQDLLRVTREFAQLLVDAVQTAPIVPAYFSQIAAHFLTADQTRFQSRYRDVIKSAFVRRGILSLDSASMPVTAAAPIRPRARGRALGIAGLGGSDVEPHAMTIASARYGLRRPLRVVAASEEPRIAAMSSAKSLGPEAPPTSSRSAESFVEDLFRQGRIEVGRFGDPETRIYNPYSRKTHVIEGDGQELKLTRRFFDCGFDGS